MITTKKRFKVFIPYTDSEGGLSLLSNVLHSLKHIENSVEIVRDDIGGHIKPTFVQKMNYIRSEAIRTGLDCYFFIHHDAKFLPDLIETLLDYGDITDDWGMIQTNEDVVSLFKTEVVKSVGEWDTFFTQYYADIDYYRRIGLVSRVIKDETLKECVQHVNDGSNTLKNNNAHEEFVNRTFPFYRDYYIAKWGGDMGKERFKTPFNK